MYSIAENANKSVETENRSSVIGDGSGTGEAGQRDCEGHEKPFGGDGYGHRRDCNDGFIGGHMCQNLINYTL